MLVVAVGTLLLLASVADAQDNQQRRGSFFRPYVGNPLGQSRNRPFSQSQSGRGIMGFIGNIFPQFGGFNIGGSPPPSQSMEQPSSNSAAPQPNYNPAPPQPNYNPAPPQPNYNPAPPQPNYNNAAPQPNYNNAAQRPNYNNAARPRLEGGPVYQPVASYPMGATDECGPLSQPTDCNRGVADRYVWNEQYGRCSPMRRCSYAAGGWPGFDTEEDCLSTCLPREPAPALQLPALCQPGWTPVRMTGNVCDPDQQINRFVWDGAKCIGDIYCPISPGIWPGFQTLQNCINACSSTASNLAVAPDALPAPNRPVDQVALPPPNQPIAPVALPPPSRPVAPDSLPPQNPVPPRPLPAQTMAVTPVTSPSTPPPPAPTTSEPSPTPDRVSEPTVVAPAPVETNGNVPGPFQAGTAYGQPVSNCGPLSRATDCSGQKRQRFMWFEVLGKCTKVLLCPYTTHEWPGFDTEDQCESSCRIPVLPPWITQCQTGWAPVREAGTPCMWRDQKYRSVWNGAKCMTDLYCPIMPGLWPGFQTSTECNNACN